jgi:hypothetical protein
MRATAVCSTGPIGMTQDIQHLPGKCWATRGGHLVLIEAADLVEKGQGCGVEPNVGNIRPAGMDSKPGVRSMLSHSGMGHAQECPAASDRRRP